MKFDYIKEIEKSRRNDFEGDLSYLIHIKKAKEICEKIIDEIPKGKKLIAINKCEDCPFHVYDDNNTEERWGKSWCDKLDKEIKNPLDIPDDCPL